MLEAEVNSSRSGISLIYQAQFLVTSHDLSPNMIVCFQEIKSVLGCGKTFKNIGIIHSGKTVVPRMTSGGTLQKMINSTVTEGKVKTPYDATILGNHPFSVIGSSVQEIIRLIRAHLDPPHPKVADITTGKQSLNYIELQPRDELQSLNLAANTP